MASGDPGLSRRALLGAGLGRLRERVDDEARRSAGPPPAPPAATPAAVEPLRGWGEGDEASLGGRLGPVAAALLAAGGVVPGDRVLDLAAGDGTVALPAARAGARVTAVESSPERVERGRERAAREGLEIEWLVGTADALPVGDGAFDAVTSAFGLTYVPAQRAAVAELTRVLRPGGAVALAAWSGVMARVLHAVRRPGDVRPERWNRYETAYLHFFDWPGMDVVEASTTWWFAGEEAALAALCGPAPDPERARAALPALLARHGAPGDRGLALAVAYAVVTARRP